eukprot:TRINITY_DN20852_c0_g1_i1.p1 TRINITY_DN20852_c0_g1~~TRINITY_DN20852_c0_g1_i1.p1  ORF type:complete len:416 (-),score=47.74 TRINITY_DN20852_c0_g1_i1:199-1446(-)
MPDAWDWQDSFDEEDVGTLDSFSEVDEGEVIKFVLPEAERARGKKFRCCLKDTFKQFCVGRPYYRAAHGDLQGEQEFFGSTPMVALDLLAYDLDFLLRLIEDVPGDQPVVVHISEIRRLEPGRFIHNYEPVTAHLYLLQEAEAERRLWAILDQLMMSLTQGRCIKGHELQEAQPRVSWICDRCERKYTRSTNAFGCTQGCDFDVCANCFHDMPSTPQGSQAADDLRQQLIEFKREFVATRHLPSLLLPVSMPRELEWSQISRSWRHSVSLRVGKWNAVALDQRVAAGIREAFLDAFSIDSVLKTRLWMSFNPGQGSPANLRWRPPVPDDTSPQGERVLRPRRPPRPPRPPDPDARPWPPREWFMEWYSFRALEAICIMLDRACRYLPGGRYILPVGSALGFGWGMWKFVRFLVGA